MKTFYLGRQRFGGANYNVFVSPPELRRDGEWYAKTHRKRQSTFCPSLFERTTGVKLKEGEVAKFRVSSPKTNKTVKGSKIFYIGRSGWKDSNYHLFAIDPQHRRDGYWRESTNDRRLAAWGPAQFESLFGIKIKEGEKGMFRLTRVKEGQ